MATRSKFTFKMWLYFIITDFIVIIYDIPVQQKSRNGEDLKAKKPFRWHFASAGQNVKAYPQTTVQSGCTNGVYVEHSSVFTLIYQVNDIKVN